MSCHRIIGLVAGFMLFASTSFAQQPQGGQTITVVADVTVTAVATVIKAANNARRAISCTNTSTTVHVRWGSASVTATAGQRVPAGASVEIKSLGAVYMISEGSDVTVSCTEEAQ